MLSCRAYSKVFLHPLQQDDASFPTGGQLHTDRIPGFSNTRKLTRASQCVGAQFERGLWRNGSASDSRSEGWAFESLWPHLTNFITHQQPRTKQEIYSNVYYDERDHDGLPNNQCVAHVGKCAHAGSRTRVTSMGGLYDAVTLHALLL